jgi:cytidylate kinase
MVVAIDGPAGVGKSSIARMLADKLGFYYLNTGSFYRAITYAAVKAGIDIGQPDKVLEFAKTLHLSVISGNIAINGVDVEGKLHLPEVDLNASRVSSNPELRKYLNSLMLEIVKGMDVVTEGRDTTTVIFPDAEIKCYFDANPEVRAERRMNQIATEQSYEEVLAKIKQRDEMDRNKEFGALKIASDAIYIDTSYLTIDAVCEKVISAIKNYGVDIV